MTDYSKKNVAQLQITISNLRHQVTVSETAMRQHEAKLAELKENIERAETELAVKERELDGRRVEKQIRDDYLMRKAVLKTEYRRKLATQVQTAQPVSDTPEAATNGGFGAAANGGFGAAANGGFGAAANGGFGGFGAAPTLGRDFARY